MPDSVRLVHLGYSFTKEGLGFMLQNFKEAAQKDIEAKPIISRLNMGRLYVFNIFATAVVLLITAILRVFNIKLLSESYQQKSFLLFALVLALSALSVYYLTRTKNIYLFQPAVFCYLGVFSILMYNFAFRATQQVVSLVFYWILMTVIGLIPILSLNLFLICLVCELIPITILAVIRSFSPESILCVVTMSIMSVTFSCLTYSAAIRKLDFQISLDNAVNESETDPMTRLLNRRGLEHKLKDIWGLCARKSAGIAVLMLDIDNFKIYNDTFGHPMGDECLKQVAALIRRNVRRRTDYAARIGGEEFLVLLTYIDPEEAISRALELRNSVAEAMIPHSPKNFKPYVSMSMGLACGIVDENVTFDQMKEEADKALYDAKENGRDVLYYHHKPYGRDTSERLKASNQ